MARVGACIAFATLLLMRPTLTFAQAGAGSIAGVVKDATGAVLPGVTVEASSPALIERVRTVTTDAEGQYKIVELRPGTYAVTFSLPGFSTVRREGVELTTGFTAGINAELRVGDVAETITVSGRSPLVDVQNTKQQIVMTRDVIDEVPTSRQYQGLGALIPGIYLAQGTQAMNQDVGGLQGNGHSSMAIHGGRQLDQAIQVDGMSIAALTRIDGNHLYYTDGNFQEYAFDYAANSAEVETGGVRINMIPRDGGNVFKGRFAANVSASGLQANNISDSLRSQGLTDANRAKSLWDVNPYVGGPAVKDKLWFFVTYTRGRVDQYVAGQYLTNDHTSWIYRPDQTQQAVDDQWFYDASTRLTWQATPRNKFSTYISRNYNCQCHFLIGRGTQADAAAVADSYGWVPQLTWSSTLTNRLLIEAGMSYTHQSIEWNPERESTMPSVLDTASGIRFRSSISTVDILNTNFATRGSVSYVTGSHAAKVGFTAWGGIYRRDEFIIGSLAYTTLAGTPTSVTYYGDPFSNANYLRPNLGIYAQDVWTQKKLTVNGGVRFDYFRVGYPGEHSPATLWVPTPRDVPGAVTVNWKDISPRFGAVYDVFGNGKTALKASANRYVLQQGTPLASSVNPMQTNNTNTRRWNDANADYVVQGDPFNPAQNGELGPSSNLNFGKPLASARNDPAFAMGFGLRPYEWEFSAGLQHELLPRLSVNAAYFRRIYGNFQVTDNQAVSPTDYTPYCVTTPADSRLPGGGGQQICGLFDLNANKVGQLNNVVTSANNYGAQYEHWNGLDLTVNARIPRVLVQGGISTGKTLQDNCDITTRYPEVVVPGFAGNPVATSSSPSTSTQFCRVETPFLTQLKLLGSYTMPFGVQLAATFQNVPGPLILANAVYTSAQIAPSLGRPLASASTATINIVEPGTLYGDRMNQLDFRFTKIVGTGARKVQGSIDLYNALNANSVLVLNNTYGATTGATRGAAWQVPQGILAGRLMKFSVQVYF